MKHITNRTIFTGDNLDILKGFDSDSVDLIYTDPPFNSNRNYSAPIGSEAAGAFFKDAWTLDDISHEEHGELADRQPGLYHAIDAAGFTHSKGNEGLLHHDESPVAGDEKDSQADRFSIYLHCDPIPPSHYLKMVMDAIFGANASLPNDDHLSATDAASMRGLPVTQFGRVHGHASSYYAKPRWTAHGIRKCYMP